MLHFCLCSYIYIMIVLYCFHIKIIIIISQQNGKTEMKNKGGKNRVIFIMFNDDNASSAEFYEKKCQVWEIWSLKKTIFHFQWSQLTREWKAVIRLKIYLRHTNRKRREIIKLIIKQVVISRYVGRIGKNTFRHFWNTYWDLVDCLKFFFAHQMTVCQYWSLLDVRQDLLSSTRSPGSVFSLNFSVSRPNQSSNAVVVLELHPLVAALPLDRGDGLGTVVPVAHLLVVPRH